MSKLALRPFLDTLYAPHVEILCPADEVMVCRCEEVTTSRIPDAARHGAQGPNQAKSFLRAGMGPCQGRICGPVVTEILAETLGQTPDTRGYYRIRPPLKPVTIGELAALDPTA
jgi:bacterioferritin-associated ferredoxin